MGFGCPEALMSFGIVSVSGAFGGACTSSFFGLEEDGTVSQDEWSSSDSRLALAVLDPPSAAASFRLVGSLAPAASRLCRHGAVALRRKALRSRTLLAAVGCASIFCRPSNEFCRRRLEKFPYERLFAAGLNVSDLKSNACPERRQKSQTRTCRGPPVSPIGGFISR